MLTTNDRRSSTYQNGNGVEREKRHEGRKTPNHHPEAWVEISLPFSKGVRVVKEIIEWSEKGLSFKMAQEEGSLLPGTIIKHLIISHNGKQIEEPFAEVMYAKPLDEDGYFKVGIQLMRDPRKRSALGRRMATHPLRPVRYRLSRLGSEEKTVHFSDQEGLFYSCLLKNISDYGLAFELEETPTHSFLRISNTIDPLEVWVGNRSIYSGKGTIATLRSNHGKVIVGISLGEKCDKLHDVLLGDQKTKSVDLKSTFLRLEKVDTSFKAFVADMRYFLEAVKEAMAKEENKSSLEGAVHRHQIEKETLEQFERSVFGYFDDALKNMNRLVSDFDEQAHAYHRDYFQKQLGDIIWQSPFVKRCYKKPLGYAGDYEMMDMIYRDPYEGDTLFAKLLNKYFCHHVKVAEANRNRTPFLLKKIEQAAGNGIRDGRRSRILSLACGPANEAVEFIRKNKMSSHTELTFIDIEPEALYYTNEILLEAKMQNERQTKINVYYIPLSHLIKGTSSYSASLLEHQDLVYCSGLFDYLSEEICKKTIQRLFKMLGKGGTLVIGNVDPCNEFKTCMEYCAEWYLIYRTPGDLLQLANEAVKEEAHIFCEAEPTGINNFLIMQK